VKIAYTSDIHIDYSPINRRLLPYLVLRIAALNPDVFVLAGDVANTLACMNDALAPFEQLDCLKVMVPGNHDVWTESNRQVRKGHDSFYKYREAIPEICRRHGFVCPVASPHMAGDIAVVGNIGWYDYSLQDARLSSNYDRNDYDRGTFGSAVWNDKRYAVWLARPGVEGWRQRRLTLSNDAVFARHFGDLRSAVQQIPAGVEKALLVLHTAPFSECITPKAQPSPFDAYQGSAAIGDFIETVVAVDRQVHIICGHRHEPLFLERGSVRVYRSPVVYLAGVDIDYAATAAQAIGEFEM
jgi:predicted phosphohydrolase